jgi:hypothetical protein
VAIDESAYRGDRVREFSAVPAVIGLLLALLTDAPPRDAFERRPTSHAVANTTRNAKA